MDRSLQARIRKIERSLSGAEELVSHELKKRADEQAEWIKQRRPEARLHATAVAAIVIAGEPKIDEPLLHAWMRGLRNLDIRPVNEYGREFRQLGEHEFPEELWDYRAHWELRAAYDTFYPRLMGGENEAQKFTEVFRNAPIWLLEFTWMRWDARYLEFQLPRLADKQTWGEDGFEDSLKWPLLPLGVMTAGNLVPEIEIPPDVAPDDAEAYRQTARMTEYLKRREADYWGGQDRKT